MLSARSRRTARTDLGLLLIVLAALVVGLVMVYSASYHFPLADREFEKPSHYFLSRQVVFALVGLSVLFVLSRVDYHVYRRFAVYILLATVGVLVVMAILSIIRGGARWLIVGKIKSVQPAELAKLGAMIYVAIWLSSKGERLREFSLGLVPFSVLLATIAGLIVVQPDVSTAALVVASASAMFFVAGVDTKQFVLWLVLAGLAFLLVALVTPHVRKRLLEWIAGAGSEASEGRYQLKQSMDAFHRGGFLGVGLGQSEQKLRLYAPHSDCLFAIIGEEIGLVGSMAVMMLYALWTWRGLRLALHAADAYGSLLAVGLVAWVAFQAAIHIGALTGLTPLTGTVLPFMSAGGSSLITCLASVGILLSISRGSGAEGQERDA